MTQLKVLNLNYCDKVTGSLEDLKGLVNLIRLEMDGVEEMEGSLSHLENMLLTVLQFTFLSKVEGSLSCFQNMPLIPNIIRNERNRYTLQIPHFSLQGTRHPILSHPRSKNVRCWGEDRRTDLQTLSKL